MELDQETFLTTAYCIVDDLYQAQFADAKPPRPGRKPTLSDSEVLTLTLLAQWKTQRSESAFYAYAVKHWRGYFPQLVSRSDLNRRSRDLSGVLCQSDPALYHLTAQCPGAAAYQVLDGVPVPLMRRCRGDAHRVFGWEAAISRAAVMTNGITASRCWGRSVRAGHASTPGRGSTGCAKRWKRSFTVWMKPSGSSSHVPAVFGAY